MEQSSLISLRIYNLKNNFANADLPQWGGPVNAIHDFGGIVNVKTLRPLMVFLIRRGYSGIAMEILRLPLNLIGVRALFREAASKGLNWASFLISW